MIVESPSHILIYINTLRKAKNLSLHTVSHYTQTWFSDDLLPRQSKRYHFGQMVQKPAIWQSSWDTQCSCMMYLNTVSTAQCPTFGINQLPLSCAFLCYDHFISAWPAVMRVFRHLWSLGSLYEAIMTLWAHAWICAHLVQLTSPIVYHALCMSTVHASLHVLASISCFCWYQRSWIVHASLLFPYKHSSIVSCAWFRFNSKWSLPILYKRASLPPLSMWSIYAASEFNRENS